MLLPPVVLPHRASVEVQAVVFSLGCEKCVPSVCIVITL